MSGKKKKRKKGKKKELERVRVKAGGIVKKFLSKSIKTMLKME